MATKLTIEERFMNFHEHNPQIYRELVKLAREAHARGHKHCSINMLFELLRWRSAIATDGQDPYKLGNTYRSRYARLIMSRESDLAGIFITKKLQRK